MPEPRTPEQDMLLDSIFHHLFELNRKNHFAERFAKDNELPLALAYDLINEYGKYLFIVREGHHPVAPPPLIDKVWHHHLLYTEAYWGDLCPNILGRPLHHIPATGLKKETAQFDDWGAQTLDSYRKFFGDPPPAWLAPKNTRNRPLLEKVGFALAGAALGTCVVFFWFGQHIVAIVCAALLAIPSAILFGLASDTPTLRFPIPRKIEGPHTSAKCGATNCASSSSGSGSDGGHGGGHSCGGGY